MISLFLFAVVLGLICLVINKQWNGKYRVANTLGQLAGTLCFLVILPASRSATWIWIFGIPFERATMLLYTPRIFMIMITIFVDLIILSIATSNYSNISSTASTSTSRHARTTIIKYLLATSWINIFFCICTNNLTINKQFDTYSFVV